MTCKDCGQDKPVDAFYKHPKMTLGVLSSCKECRKAYQRTRHHLNMRDPVWAAKERKRGRDKARSPSARARACRYREANPEKFIAAGRRYRERNPEKVADTCRQWRRNNPNEWKAHCALNNAVRDGKIIKPKICERCGEAKLLHAHHPDYSKPMEIEWLCSTCHRREHIGRAA